MKKVLLAILITLFWVSLAYSGPWDGWSSGGIETAKDCNVAAYYPLGTLCQDTDDGKLYKGTGVGVTEIAAGSSGDVTAATTDITWGDGTGPSVFTFSVTGTDPTITATASKIAIGGTLDLGSNNLTTTGSLGATGAGKLTKGWFIDLESTNMPTVNGTAIDSTFMPIGWISRAGTNNVLTYTGNYSLGLTLSNNTAVTLPTSGTLATTTYKPADLSIASQAAGDVLYFNGTNWVRLAADAGKYLKSGASAVSWDTPTGAAHDAVTLGATATSILGLSTQELGFDTQTANYVLAGPTTGAAAAPTFRALVSGDIPNNAADTSGNAGTATSLASNPTDCGANALATAIDASGNLTCGKTIGTDVQTELSILKGTYTNGYLCKYTSSGTLLDCNTDPAGFQTADSDLTTIAALSCTENQIIKKNGAGAWACAADANDGGAGDVTASGDCASGACGDGTSDGGTYYEFYGAAGNVRIANNGGVMEFQGPAGSGFVGIKAASVVVAKTSGQAGDISLYEANSTDTHAAGFRGPASITGDGAYRIQFPNARASAANQILAVTNAGESGSGTAADPYIQAGSWVTPLTSGGALGTPSSGTLTNCTGLPIAGTTGWGTGVATAAAINVGTAGALTTTLATGTQALGTAEIAASACASVATTSATGVATTDVIDWGFNGDPTSTTGYTAGAMLTIIAYPTANNVNFKVCNNTAAAITPSAVTLNWRVRR